MTLAKTAFNHLGERNAFLVVNQIYKYRCETFDCTKNLIKMKNRTQYLHSRKTLHESQSEKRSTMNFDRKLQITRLCISVDHVECYLQSETLNIEGIDSQKMIKEDKIPSDFMYSMREQEYFQVCIIKQIRLNSLGIY
ncbi:hypothetical protein O9G_002175 [Rozella allomycis CSF55]|uniref:Uncharacterized protein n=1 Tax=Rozella allomycis (strain CSF55) TaxID=988480 RepID=A0A075AUW4_ROZAC|nr:hypothetical protein O9G_002175 [Rozella allomycis CSF55]|eukprot:EPZ32334.1 hypothetical protein O9G_002175 [Rozella allomycis CSF55]